MFQACAVWDVTHWIPRFEPSPNNERLSPPVTDYEDEVGNPDRGGDNPVSIIGRFAWAASLSAVLTSAAHSFAFACCWGPEVTGLWKHKFPIWYYIS